MFPHYDKSVAAGNAAMALSLARTALDEGYAYDGVNDTTLSPEEMRSYVIEQIDAAMRLIRETEEQIQAHIDDNLVARERLWLMYSPEHEERWDEYTPEQVHEAYEALTPEEHERIYETQFSSESYEEKECIDALAAGLEIALKLVKGEAA